tara:strand:+ start:387 stop:578 length:192 start_codon:yes stop_codon:yes gene_type:complete
MSSLTHGSRKRRLEALSRKRKIIKAKTGVALQGGGCGVVFPICSFTQIYFHIFTVVLDFVRCA